MQEFYKKALIVFVGLVLLSVVVGYVCLDRTFLRESLLPAGTGELRWSSQAESDANQGGQSIVRIDDDKFSLSFEFTLAHKIQYPSVTVSLVFKDRDGKTTLVDLTPYDHLSFSVKCSPANILTFFALTFEDKVSVANDQLTYRGPSTFFSCSESWNRIEVDLTRLETPQWWFDMFKLQLSEREYQLNKVPRLSFGSSSQTPFDVPSKVQLEEIMLSGHNWVYIYLLGGFLLGVWGGYGFWFFRQHTQAVIGDLRDKIQRDRPLVAYQQLTVEPHRDKDKSAILHFMATNYSNAELSLEGMAASIAVSRTKINDILKAELGFTFTGYLNKLRLTEAARLLAEKEDANIAEIAYSVGYKNVSYFNKLFKEEYGCTPKTFKSICDRPPGASPAEPG